MKCLIKLVFVQFLWDQEPMNLARTQLITTSSMDKKSTPLIKNRGCPNTYLVDEMAALEQFYHLVVGGERLK